MRKLARELVEQAEQERALDGPIMEVGSLILRAHTHHADLRPIFPDREYVGIDIREGRGVDQVADIMCLPFEDETFGSVVTVDTFEHVRDPFKGVDEIHRVLKPGGQLIFIVPFSFPIHEQPDYWRFTPEGVEYLLRNFSEVKVTAHGPEPTKPPLVCGIAVK